MNEEYTKTEYQRLLDDCGRLYRKIDLAVHQSPEYPFLSVRERDEIYTLFKLLKEWLDKQWMRPSEY